MPPSPQNHPQSCHCSAICLCN